MKTRQARSAARLAAMAGGSSARTSAYALGAWQLRSLCRGMDPEIFFPVGTTGPAAARIRAAKRICHDCPVAVSCLAWALRHGEDWGVWGGLSERERRRLLADRRRPAKPALSGA